MIPIPKPEIHESFSCNQNNSNCGQGRRNTYAGVKIGTPDIFPAIGTVIVRYGKVIPTVIELIQVGIALSTCSFNPQEEEYRRCPFHRHCSSHHSALVVECKSESESESCVARRFPDESSRVSRSEEAQ